MKRLVRVGCPDLERVGFTEVDIMNMNCIIADAVARIKNAKNNDQLYVEVLWSKHCFDVLRVLERAKVLRSVASNGATKPKNARINVELHPDGFQEIKIDSKPGRIVHVTKGRIPRYKNGFGVVVISTSKGVMTGAEARAQSIGGKVILRAF